MPRKKKTEEETKTEVVEATAEVKVEKLSAADKKSKLAELMKKAKELESKVEEVKEVSLKEKVKEKIEAEKGEKKETLVPMEDYLKSSIHLGTRVITPDMRKYVYRRRADGLAVFNTALLDELIKEGSEYLSKFSPQDIIIVCKREAGWKAVRRFSEITGIS